MVRNLMPKETQRTPLALKKLPDKCLWRGTQVVCIWSGGGVTGGGSTTVPNLQKTRDYPKSSIKPFFPQ